MDLRMWVQGKENARELSKQGIEVWTPVPFLRWVTPFDDI